MTRQRHTPAAGSRAAAALAFAAAVVAATALGSIAQTQFNLAAIEALGAPLPPRVRLDSTLHDLGSFTLVYVVLVAAAFAIALPVASWLARVTGDWRVPLHVAAAAVGVWVAFRFVDAASPVPTFIAATRSLAGTLAMMLAAAAGGWLFTALARGRR